MRRYYFIVWALLGACSKGEDWKPSKEGEIFRYMTVGRSAPLDSILLGQPWKSAAKYGASDGDTLTALPYGSFGGADAIAVHRDTKGIVTELVFVYHMKRDTRALVADYQSSLGQPIAITLDMIAGSTRTTTRWCDDDTEFVIETIAPALMDDVGAVAQLIDRRSNSADRGLTKSCR